jgi:hypothetical protein
VILLHCVTALLRQQLPLMTIASGKRLPDTNAFTAVISGNLPAKWSPSDAFFASNGMDAL